MPVSLPERHNLHKGILLVCAFAGSLLFIFVAGLFLIGRSVKSSSAPLLMIPTLATAQVRTDGEQNSTSTKLPPVSSMTASPEPQEPFTPLPSVTLTPTIAITVAAATEPPHSPFWGKIAFISDRSGYFAMYLADIDHMDDAQLVPHPPEYEDVFDPTFCRKNLGFEVQKRNSFGQWIYYWWDSASNTIQPMDLPTTPGLVGAPRCSPDGRYFAYTDLTVRPWKLLVVDLSDGSIALKHASGTLAGFASWNSNNTDLYSMTFSDSVYQNQQIQGFSNVSNVVLTKSDRGPISSAYYPAISPDGATLAFICRVSGEFYLCTTGPAFTNAHILDTVSGVKYKGFTLPFGTPSWSADGEWIYYSTQAGNNLDIFRIRPDGSGRENLTPNWPSNEIQPTIGW